MGFEEALGACFVRSSRLRVLRIAGSIIVELVKSGGSMFLRELRAKGLSDSFALSALERAGVVERVRGRRNARLILTNELGRKLAECTSGKLPARAVIAFIGISPYTLAGRVLEKLVDGAFWSYEELASELGANYSYVTSVVTTLEELGLVIKGVGSGLYSVGRPPHTVYINKHNWSRYEGMLRARLARFASELRARSQRELVEADG